MSINSRIKLSLEQGQRSEVRIRTQQLSCEHLLVRGTRTLDILTVCLSCFVPQNQITSYHFSRPNVPTPSQEVGACYQSRPPSFIPTRVLQQGSWFLLGFVLVKHSVGMRVYLQQLYKPINSLKQRLTAKTMTQLSRTEREQ